MYKFPKVVTVTDGIVQLCSLQGLQFEYNQLPVPKLIKGLGPSLHIVQIERYNEMSAIARKNS